VIAAGEALKETVGGGVDEPPTTPVRADCVMVPRLFFTLTTSRQLLLLGLGRPAEQLIAARYEINQLRRM
jgi:hypothetical protein